MAKIFLLFLGFAAIFVGWSSGAMPESVASHFGPGGVANGFMPRQSYAMFMVVLMLLVPSLIYFATRSASRLPVALINLPNKGYWLAPERQASSLASLGRFGTFVAYATAFLLCLVHWMVIQANRVQPPQWEVAPLVAVMGLFFAVLGVAMMVFLGKFFRVPRLFYRGDVVKPASRAIGRASCQTIGQHKMVTVTREQASPGSPL